MANPASTKQEQEDAKKIDAEKSLPDIKASEAPAVEQLYVLYYHPGFTKRAVRKFLTAEVAKEFSLNPNNKWKEFQVEMSPVLLSSPDEVPAHLEYLKIGF